MEYLGAEDRALRIAIINVFKPQDMFTDPDLGDMFCAREYYRNDGTVDLARTFCDLGLPVPLSTLGTKVVRASKPRGDQAFVQHYFQAYAFSSGLN